MVRGGLHLCILKNESHRTCKTCRVLHLVHPECFGVDVSVSSCGVDMAGRVRSDIVATGSHDGTIRVWDLSDYSIVLQWCGFVAMFRLEK
jgi:WD40 repeat protein